MDDMIFIAIELHAMTACVARQEGAHTDRPLGELITDADYRAGVIEEFGSEEGFEDWMVEPLVEQVKAHIIAREQIMAIADDLLESMWGFSGAL